MLPRPHELTSSGGSTLLTVTCDFRRRPLFLKGASDCPFTPMCPPLPGIDDLMSILITLNVFDINGAIDVEEVLGVIDNRFLSSVC